MIVHDLRSPLAGILAGTEILMGGLAGELTDDQRQIVEILTGSSRRLMSLVNEVLDMSRIDAGRLNLHREDFAVQEAVRRVADESRFIAGEKSIGLEYTVAPEVGLLNADREKLEQVLINLVTNAVKFTPVGGKVTLRVRLDGDRKGNFIRFEVEDTGPGLTDEERSKLFQKYSELEGRKKAELKGTGLGLFICKSIVEAHGGTIGVESTPGEGSLFHFRLPMAK
jgi:signal transduction histidine kinase